MKIPRMTDERVQDNKLPGVNFNVRGADFGADNAKQMDSGVQSVVKAGIDIYEKEQQYADQAVQLEAGSRLAQFELSQNQKIREYRGERAMMLSDEYNRDIVKVKAEMDGLAKNDRQKGMIGRLFLSTDSQLQNNILAHQSRENAEVYKSKSVSYIESARAAAVDSDNPMTIAESVEKQQAVVSQLSDFMGEPKETKELKMAAVKEQTYVDWISQKAVNDPVGATAMLEDKAIQEMIGDQGTLRTLKNFADRQMAIIRRQEREAVLKNDMDTGLKVASGEISSVDQIAKIQNISSERAEAYVAYLSDKDNVDFGDAEAFAVYADAVFDLDNKDAINKLTNSVFTGGENRRVNKGQLQAYLKIANIRSQGLSLAEYREYKDVEKSATRKKATKEDKAKFEKVKKPMTEVDVLYKNISEWARTYTTTPEEKEQIIKDFADWTDKIGKKINNGEALTIDDAKNDIIAKAQTRANPNRVTYSVGQIIQHPSGGSLKVVSFDEDGEPIVEWVK